MEIAFFCANNSHSHHFCPDDLWGRGLGGAEQYLISLAEELAREHEIIVFNQPPRDGMYGRVLYTHTDGFDCQHPYDCFILYRNPDVATMIATAARVKLFLSCDQQTSGDYRTDAFPHVDHTVCISPYHVNYHRERYGVAAERISHIEIGVRQQDYRARVRKVPGQCIYCSIPDRGLEHLAVIWPQIKELVPHATLFITSDYRLWGISYPGNDRWVERFRGMPGVRFVGRVAREELVRLQLSSDLMVYPSDYEELFCVSAAECMVAGAYPITSTFGALPTTARAGTLITGLPASASYRMAFVKRAVSLLRDREELSRLQREISAYAKARFRYSDIADRWIGIIRDIQKRRTDVESDA